VIVTVAVPFVAPALAARVNVLLALAGFGTKLAVTPLGKPDAEKVTFPLKPLDGAIVIAVEPLVPCTTVRLLGLADNEKLGVAVTVNVIVVVSVKLPDVPVTVTVDVPVVAVELAVRVNVLEDVAGLGLNAAVTPLGKPEAENVTLPLKPLAGVIVIVLVPALPCRTLKLLGFAVNEKVGAAFTVRPMVAVCVRVPEVPVTVTVAAPVVAVALAVRVSVLDEAVGFGLKAAVTPVGSPDADKVTFPLKPLTGVTVIVLVLLLPCTTATLLGLAANVKLFAALVTVKLIVIVCVRLADVPVTLTSVVPTAALALAVNFNVLDDVAGFGLNEAVTPLGSPDAVKVTLPLNPVDAATLITVEALLPCGVLSVLGAAAIVKTAGQLFTRL
jgi:hypothetical protein